MLTQAEVAKLFKVDSKTVARWANKGLLGYTRTLGGHRRYYADEVYKVLESRSTPRSAAPSSERES